MTVPKEATTPDMLRLAVAAVLEADKEFRANMPPEWEGDPLSDEIDGLRRVFSSTLPIAGEGKVKALEWYKPLGNSTLSRADTILGSYRVWTHFEANGEWFWDGGNGHENAATSEGGAKAAAQSDFETRILSALISSPGNDGGQEVEAVGEAGEMPGSNGGFTMAAFKASKVPLGTIHKVAAPDKVLLKLVDVIEAAYQRGREDFRAELLGLIGAQRSEDQP